MRRIILLASMLIAVGALAVDLNHSKPMKYVDPTTSNAAAGYTVLDSVARGYSAYDHWYLIQAQADEDVTIRRKFDDGWEPGPGITIKAGKSLIFNIPYSWNAAGTYQVQLVQLSALTDTLEYMPWVR